MPDELDIPIFHSSLREYLTEDDKQRLRDLLACGGAGFRVADMKDQDWVKSCEELGLVFRTHEGLQRATNWSWDRDDDTTTHFARFARVHRVLAAEIRALGDEHQRTGMPIVRALALAFPADPRGYDVRDEYLLGDALLVAPVVEMGATSRTVYFPAGTWFDVWDPARRYDGPREVTVEAPIGRPPVFSRAARGDLLGVR